MQFYQSYNRQFTWKILNKNPHLLIQLAKMDVKFCRFILLTPELSRDFSGESLFDLISIYKDDIAKCIIDQKYLFQKITDTILDHLNIYSVNGLNANHYITQYVKIARYLFENHHYLLGERYLYIGACKGDDGALKEYIAHINNMTAPDEHDSNDIKTHKTKLKLIYRIVFFFIYADPDNSLHDKAKADSLLHNDIIKNFKEVTIIHFLVKYLDNSIDDNDVEVTTILSSACAIIKFLSQHYSPLILFEAVGDHFHQCGKIKAALSCYLIATLMKSAASFKKLQSLINPDDGEWQMLLLLVYSDSSNIFFDPQKIEKGIPQLKPEMSMKFAETIIYYIKHQRVLVNDYAEEQLKYFAKLSEQFSLLFKLIPSIDIYYHLGYIFYENESLNHCKGFI